MLHAHIDSSMRPSQDPNRVSNLWALTLQPLQSRGNVSEVWLGASSNAAAKTGAPVPGLIVDRTILQLSMLPRDPRQLTAFTRNLHQPPFVSLQQ